MVTVDSQCLAHIVNDLPIESLLNFLERPALGRQVEVQAKPEPLIPFAQRQAPDHKMLRMHGCFLVGLLGSQTFEERISHSFGERGFPPLGGTRP